MQIMTETWHAQELTITRKSLGLFWKGVTLNNLKRLLLKSGCQRKPGKMFKMSTEGGQQNKLILTL